jgi:acetyl esterase/lipase
MEFEMLKTTRILALGLLLVAALLPMQVASQQGAAAPSQGDLQVTPDVVYGHKVGMALTFDVLRPANAHGGAVLYMVSGGWVSRWQQPRRLADRMFSGLLEEGLTVIAVRHGSAPRFKVPEAEADVRRALRYVRLHAADLGVDADRLGVFGGSAGGHLSLMLGLGSDEGEQDSTDEVLRTPARVAAVVAYYPPVDIRPITGPNDRFPALDFPQEQAAAISPILFVTPDDPPTLLIHGDADTLVPISASESMYAALQAESVESEFITIEGGDHGFMNQEHRARAQAAMVAWFAGHLAPSSGG